jgi:LysR family hydrogen peroxide-inducible transcriptional activator
VRTIVREAVNILTLQELRYLAALAEHRHFGRAAEACHVSQPTLSGQIRKLEEHLGVTLLERTNKRVDLTPICERIIDHARKALEEASLVEAVARASRDQLADPLKLGVIPTLAPDLMPLVLGPIREAYPQMRIELWEDLTIPLLEMLRSHRLDAALIATEVVESDLVSIPLFVEPFVAALPRTHRLTSQATVDEADLAGDLLVLADGHCLATQTLSACGREAGHRTSSQAGSFQAASLDTLVNLVAAGYGTTLIPSLAAKRLGARGVVLRPLSGKASRTIRLTCRRSFPRPQALKALEKVIRRTVQFRTVAAENKRGGRRGR